MEALTAIGGQRCAHSTGRRSRKERLEVLHCCSCFLCICALVGTFVGGSRTGQHQRFVRRNRVGDHDFMQLSLRVSNETEMSDARSRLVEHRKWSGPGQIRNMGKVTLTRALGRASSSPRPACFRLARNTTNTHFLLN
jgi:hypothetical protein